MDPLKVIMLAGAAYLAYSYFAAPGAPATGETGSTTGGTTGGSGGSNTSNGNSAASARAALKVLMQAEATRLGVPAQTGGDDWNFVYHQVRGVEAPDVLVMWPGRDRSFKMTLDEYLDVAMQNGVAGLNYRHDRRFGA